MLPVEVFLQNICHDDSLFLTIPMEDYLLTIKKSACRKAYVFHNTNVGQGRCGLGEKEYEDNRSSLESLLCVG